MPVSSVAGGVAKSEQSVTAGEIEVGGASSDDDRPCTVLKLVPEIQIKSFIILAVIRRSV